MELFVPKDSALLNWHETEILVDADYSEMVKCVDATDNKYIIFRQIIQKIIKTRIDEGAVENGRLMCLTVTNTPHRIGDGNQDGREV